AKTMLDHFGDQQNGGFYFTARDATDLIVRQKTASDSPLPSGNAVAAIALLELDQSEQARRVLEAFAGQMQRQAEGMSSMVQAALRYVTRHGPIEVTPRESARQRAGVASPEQMAAGVVSVRRATWATPTQLNLHLDILEGFHINAHNAGAGLIPTTVETPGANTLVGYPPGQERK